MNSDEFKDKAERENINIDVFFLMLIIGLGIYFRIPLLSVIPHLDEIWHFGISSHETLKRTIVESSKVAHPPIYFVLLRLWMPFGDSMEWLRSLSQLFNLLSVVFVYHICLKLNFDRLYAVAISVVWVTTPIFMNVGNLVRGYSVSQFFLWMNIYFLISILEKGYSLKRISFFFLSGMLALSTIYGTIFQITATTIALIFYLLKKSNVLKMKERVKRLLKLSPFFFMPLIPLCYLYIFYDPKYTTHTKNFLYKGGLCDLDEILRFVDHSSKVYFLRFHRYFSSYERILFISGIATIGWIICFKKRRISGILPLLLVILTTLISQLIASLLGLFPYGGYWYHDSSTYIVVFLYVVLGSFFLIEHLKMPKKFNLGVAIMLSILSIVNVGYLNPIRSQFWDSSDLIHIVRHEMREPVSLGFLSHEIIRFVYYSTGDKFFKKSTNQYNTRIENCLKENIECFYLIGSFYDAQENSRYIKEKFKDYNLTVEVLREENFYAGKLLLFSIINRGN